ncbi:MAG: ankyrin repeat domain-containing protein, partial [Alphaproteobacteria bacterium]|nr:ankyrin repeat domain-containing protein [Alphaproteobacteria bacterium]
NGYGAIHLASSNGCLDVVKALIEADPDLVNNSNSTLKNWQPLDFALRGNHNEVAKYLYANGGATAILPMPSWLQPSSSTNAQNFNSLAGERELTNSI